MASGSKLSGTVSNNSDADDFDLDAFLPYKSALLASIVSENFSRNYSDKFGISVYEWRTLAHLNQQSHLSVKDIAERANLDRASVTRAVARMEARGFVVKEVDPRDKRLVEIHLTPEGSDLVEQIVPVALDFENALVEMCVANGFDDPHRLLDLLIMAARDFNERKLPV